MDTATIGLSLYLDELGIATCVATKSGRQAVQVVVYFGLLVGVDAGYRFSWNCCLPYSSILADDLFRLASGMHLSDLPREFDLKPEVLEYLAPLRELVRPPAAIHEGKPGLDQSAWLQLLATLEFAARVRRQTGPGAVKFAASINPYFADYAQEAWDRLSDVLGQLLEPVFARAS